MDNRSNRGIMEERPARGSELDAKIRQIQEELRSLRGALDHQNHVVSGLAHQMNEGLAGIQDRLSSLGQPKPNGNARSRRTSRLRRDLEKAFMDAWVRSARVI